MYEIGPVGAATQCLDNPYSDERVVPPYSSTDTEVDWRDWDVVNGMEN